MRTRRRLLRAAGHAFATWGYCGTTVDDIAREAKVSKGSYYFHFASKEDVLLSLADDWVRDRSRRLKEALRTPDLVDGSSAILLEIEPSRQRPEDEPRRLFLVFWSETQRNPKLARLLERGYREWEALIAASVRQAWEEGGQGWAEDPEAAAIAALALQDGLVIRAGLGLAGRAGTRTRTAGPRESSRRVAGSYGWP